MLPTHSIAPYDDSHRLQVNIWEDARTKGGKDEVDDAAITQQDYNKALSDQRFDKTYVDFLARLERSGKTQVLRYCSDSVHRESKVSRSSCVES